MPDQVKTVVVGLTPEQVKDFNHYYHSHPVGLEDGYEEWAKTQQFFKPVIPDTVFNMLIADLSLNEHKGINSMPIRNLVLRWKDSLNYEAADWYPEPDWNRYPTAKEACLAFHYYDANRNQLPLSLVDIVKNFTKPVPLPEIENFYYYYKDMRYRVVSLGKMQLPDESWVDSVNYISVAEDNTELGPDVYTKPLSVFQKNFQRIKSHVTFS